MPRRVGTSESPAVSCVGKNPQHGPAELLAGYASGSHRVGDEPEEEAHPYAPWVTGASSLTPAASTLPEPP